jgi:hypothetical protein
VTNDNQYEIAAGVVRRYRATITNLDGELAEIEASIRRLATLPESYARERLRNTTVQMIHVMKRIETGAATTRQAFEQLLQNS